MARLTGMRSAAFRRALKAAAKVLAFGRSRAWPGTRTTTMLGLLGAVVLALNPAGASETITYGYDAFGRLVKVGRSGTINNGASECYSYDKADNRSNVTVRTSSNCGGVVSFSVGNASVTEGGNLVLTVTKTGTTTGTTTVDYATANGTATAGSDYTSKSGTLTFLSSDTSKTVSVATIDDASVESAETLLLNISNPTGGATVGDGQGVGTINDNDSAANCSGVSFTIASNGAVTEGSNSVFTVSKSGATASSCTVNYGTVNGTAIAGSDYTAKSGTLTFTSAQASQTVSVATTNDIAVESAETFAMSLSGPGSGATLGTPSSASTTISDNDGGACSGVSFSVNNASAVEADPLVFTVTKSGSTSGSCSINYATADGTAVAPGDYTAKSGTLTFTSTQSSQTVSVGTNSNALKAEPDETLSLNLSGATGGATIGDSQGLGTIIDDGLGGGGGQCNPICP